MHIEVFWHAIWIKSLKDRQFELFKKRYYFCKTFAFDIFPYYSYLQTKLYRIDMWDTSESFFAASKSNIQNELSKGKHSFLSAQVVPDI
jgi:hypothetical protein